MSGRRDVLEVVQARGLVALLDELGRLSVRQRAGAPVRLPWVTLHLRSGRNVEGVVKEVSEGGPEGRLVVLDQPGTGPQSPRDDAAFVPVSSIEALTLHDVSTYGTGGEDAPPPSPLQLKRRLAEVRAELGSAFGGELAVDLAPGAEKEAPEALRALGRLAELSLQVLRSLAADELGLSAVREKVHGLRLGVGESSAVSLEAWTLVLTTAVRPGDWYTKSELEQALQKAL